MQLKGSAQREQLWIGHHSAVVSLQSRRQQIQQPACAALGVRQAEGLAGPAQQRSSFASQLGLETMKAQLQQQKGGRDLLTMLAYPLLL